MKKYVCFILILLLVPFAAGTMSVQGEETDEVGLLEALEICDAAVLQQESITRGEFADYAVRLMNLQAPDAEGKFYSDVTADTQYGGAIELLTQMGYISGNGDGTYAPEQAITTQEAVEICVRIVADNSFRITGVNVLVQAQSAGLLSGLDLGENLDGEACVRLLRRTLEADVTRRTGFGENVTFTQQKGQDVLAYFFGVYRVKGIVEAASGVSLSGQDDLQSGYARIGGAVYENIASSLRDYLGYKVEAYVNEEDQVFYFEDNNTQVITVTDEQINRSLTSVNEIVKEEDGGSTRRYKLDSQVDVVYNGNGYFGYTLEDLLPEYGSLTLIDNDDDGTYEVVLVDDFVTCAVNIVNIDSNALVDVYGRTMPDLEDVKSIRVFKNGVETTFSAIVQNNVVGIGVDKDGENAKIVISDQMVEGTIDSVGEDTVTIGGEEYKIAPSLQECQQGMEMLVPGNRSEAILDQFGRVAYVRKSINSTLKYGWMIDVSGVTNTNFDQPQFKLLTENGGIEVFQGAYGMRLNGERLTIDLLKNAFTTNGEMNEQLVQYAVDSQGQITRVETAGGGELQMDFPYLNRSESGSMRVFADDGDFIYTTDTVIFSVPSAELDYEESNYRVLSSVDADYTKSYIAAFDVDENGIAGAVVKRSNVQTMASFTNSDMQNNPVLVVSKILEAVTSSGERIYKLCGYDRNGEQSYPVKESNYSLISGLETGDAVLLITDAHSEYVLNLMELHKRVDTTGYIHEKQVVGTNNIPWFEYAYCKVFSRYGDILRVSTKTNPVVATDYNIFPSGTATVMKVSDNDKITYGSLNDVLPGSDIFIRVRGSVVYEIIIYE